MRKSKMTNAEILRRFEIACFQITNYPKNKAKMAEFNNVRKELAKRLGITEEELEEMNVI